MSKLPPATFKPRRKRSPRPPGSPSAHRTTGYSMPGFIHEAVAAAAAGYTKSSALAKMIIEANPSAGIGHPPVKLRPLPARHGKKRPASKATRKRTITLPIAFDARLAAYSELHNRSESSVVEVLVDRHLPKLKTLKASLRAKQKAEAARGPEA